MPGKFKSSRLDANDVIFFARELEAVKAKSYDIKYPQLKATRLIPISTEAGPGANVITYEQYDSVGIGKIIANYADDSPRVDVRGKEYSTPVRSIGESYGYNVQEIRNARMAGKPLEQRRANSARKANDIKLDKLAWNARINDGVNGGLQGLIYNPNIPSAKVVTGVGGFLWSQKTAQEIYTDLVSLSADVETVTNGVEMIDTILLPIAQYEIAQSLRMSTGTDTTVLEYYKRNHPEVGLIEKVADMKDVNPVPSTLAASNTDIMIGYKRDEDHLTLEIPQPFEQFPAEQRNLEFVINCHSRSGGVIVYYPLAANIREGI